MSVSKEYNVSDKALKKLMTKHDLDPIKEQYKLKITLLKDEFKNNENGQLNKIKSFNFIKTLRINYKRKELSEEEIFEINNISERILNKETPKSRFNKKLVEVNDFIKNNKALPKRSSTNKEETNLAEFIKRHKNKEEIINLLNNSQP